MPIEFLCPSCSKTLRVPDDSAGKHAQCPNCGGIAVVPGASGTPPADTQPEWSFREPLTGGSSPPEKPPGPLNPYAPSAPIALPEKLVAGPITNQKVGLEEIMGYAWEVWKANLGLLVGVTVTVIGISWVIAFPLAFMEGAIRANGEEEMATIVGGIGNIIGQIVQIFLGIGQATIALKLARRQPAEFSDLFSGGSLFFPVLGASILAGIAMIIGFVACIVPAVILALMFWPYYWLIVDERSTVMDSFSHAYKITEGNIGTTFVLALVSIGINIIGLLALCVGIIFAAPLVTMMWVTAYLMMSGQLSPLAAKHPDAYGL